MYYGYLVDRIGGPEAFANAAQRKDGGSFADPVFIEAGKRLQEAGQSRRLPEGLQRPRL